MKADKEYGVEIEYIDLCKTDQCHNWNHWWLFVFITIPSVADFVSSPGSRVKKDVKFNLD